MKQEHDQTPNQLHHLHLQQQQDYQQQQLQQPQHHRQPGSVQQPQSAPIAPAVQRESLKSIPIRTFPTPTSTSFLGPARTTVHSIFASSNTTLISSNGNRMRIDIPPASTDLSNLPEPTPTGIKRSSPGRDSTPDIHNSDAAHSSKRTKIEAHPGRVVLGHDEALRRRGSSLPKSPGPGSVSVLATISRTNSPPLSFAGAAEAMFNRADEAASHRTTRLTRGHPASPAPSRSSPSMKTRHPSDPAIPTIKSLGRTNSMGAQALEKVGLGDFLQQDERPIFVLDTEQQLYHDVPPIVFSNNALKQRPTLYDSIFGRLDNAALLLDAGTTYVDFTRWLLLEQNASTMSNSYPFAGFTWKMISMQPKLKILTGTPIQASSPLDVSRTSTLQKFQHLGSSSSTHTLRRITPEQARQANGSHQEKGYFDVRSSNSQRKPTSPLVMEGLLNRSIPTDEADADSPAEIISNGNPASHGDSGMQELLDLNLSPAEDPRVLYVPVKSNPEHLQPMSMEYLSDRGFFDWTRMPMSPSLPDHIRFARGFDWASTSLGAMEEWPADLRGMCNLIMASPHPSAMYWGPEHVAIYNEPYIMLAGKKHPGLMGNRYSEVWSEIWDVVKDAFSAAMDSAQATMKDDDCLFVMRNGFLEETYFSWSIIPLIGDDGSVAGLYNPAFEKTRRKIAERRMLTLREVGEKTAAARTISKYWTQLKDAFNCNEYDAPLVIIYSLVDSEDSDAASSASSTAAAAKQCRFEEALGVEEGHPCAPSIIDLKHRNAKGFGPAFRRSITSDRPIVLSVDDGSLDPKMLEGVQWRGFGDPSTICVVAPIRPTSGESTLGFLVMGTNPRRPYDEDYDLFVQLLSRQLATSIASVVLFEEEIRKGELAAKMAAQDRMDLTKQLAVRTQEAVESENKFTRMAELAPVGMFICDASGGFTFANEAWYKLSSYPRDANIGNDWADMIHDDDRDIATKAWTEMLVKRCQISIEFRFKTIWKDNLGQQSHMWVIASASPEKDEDGNITTIFGSMTDISSQKVAEALQRKRMEEAVLLKQQQERYIDTTSHEMRNPLSAILQSADAITGSLTELKSNDDITETHAESIDTIIESAQTITLCAQHQKRIVDDVLTLSKLDSAMLLVTPVDVRPEAIARRTVKIFEGESHTVDISLTVEIDESYRNLNIDFVRLDPTRLSQVLINLMTNAIKFTTTQEKREVRMLIAASEDKPSREAKYSLTYIPSQAPKDKDVTASAEWGLGEPIYIHFAVSDTGRGLNDDEKKQLFQRFSQANPRTHVTYGGSGLGLFISRELVELQGGEIGVASEAGKGSTFAFYVKGRRSTGPLDGTDDDQSEHRHKLHRKTSTSRASKVSQISTQVANAEHKPITSPRTTAGQMTKSKADATGLNVLIVEDNLINQKVLAAQLRKLGCIVSVANHGGEAIEHIRRSNFYNHSTTKATMQIDVVLMDLEMPVMDGMTCARTLRAMQETGELVRHIPVVAVTANAREEQIRNTLDAGMDDVVSKPFRIPELVPKMRDTIARFPGASGRNSDASAMDLDVKEAVTKVTM